MKSPYLQTGPRRSKEAPIPCVTIGRDAGMFRGSDHFAIQGAVDYIARLGGGTVEILPGTYTLRNAIFLPSHVTLVGTPGQTSLIKGASAAAMLMEDLDWYSWSVRVAGPALFAVGDGLTLESRRIDDGRAPQVSRHTIVALDGARLHLDSPPRLNHWTTHEARAVSTHSLIEAQRASHMEIRGLVLQGNRAANEFLDSNYGGAIFLHDCEDVRIDNVTIRDFNGDAVSWQVSHDVTVENCTIDGAAMLGLHPGSGSQRPVMRNNTIRHCETGIYWCWGVRNGLAEGNLVSHCAKHGISTGHRDTDNVIRENHLSECAEAAIFFRPECSPIRTSHRVLVEGNTIECPADPATAVGISLARGVEDVILRQNEIRVPRGTASRAIVIDSAAVRPVLENNAIRES